MCAHRDCCITDSIGRQAAWAAKPWCNQHCVCSFTVPMGQLHGLVCSSHQQYHACYTADGVGAPGNLPALGTAAAAAPIRGCGADTHDLICSALVPTRLTKVYAQHANA